MCQLLLQSALAEFIDSLQQHYERNYPHFIDYHIYFYMPYAGDSS